MSEYGVFIEKDFLTGKIQISLKNSEHCNKSSIFNFMDEHTISISCDSVSHSCKSASMAESRL